MTITERKLLTVVERIFYILRCGLLVEHKKEYKSMKGDCIAPKAKL